MAKTSKTEELLAHAIWFTEGVPVYDKQAIATSIANTVGVNDVDDFVRQASDPNYGPTDPAAYPSDTVVKARTDNADKDKPKNWDQTPEGSGPVVPPGHKSRKEEGPTPDDETKAKRA
jgi:hypothetical protein